MKFPRVFLANVELEVDVDQAHDGRGENYEPSHQDGLTTAYQQGDSPENACSLHICGRVGLILLDCEHACSRQQNQHDDEQKNSHYTKGNLVYVHAPAGPGNRIAGQDTAACSGGSN